MNNQEGGDMRVESLKKRDVSGVKDLFFQYPHKNYQLRQLEVPKGKMVDFLTSGLFGDDILNFSLWENGRIEGLVSLRALPWLSGYFCTRMYSVQHLLACGGKQSQYEAMLRHVLQKVDGIDFLACRAASNDIVAIHALENSGFRFVGDEVYMVKSLKHMSVSEDYLKSRCQPCPRERLPEVLEIIDNNHLHNRYMYDPNISADKAIGIYKEFLAGAAFERDYRLLIKSNGRDIEGFILYKYNTALSRRMGRKYGSLDFIAVRENNKNLGVGDALNKGAVMDSLNAGVEYLVVRTLASNYPAIRICNKIGFKVTSTDLYFHCWISNGMLDNVE